MVELAYPIAGICIIIITARFCYLWFTGQFSKSVPPQVTPGKSFNPVIVQTFHGYPATVAKSPKIVTKQDITDAMPYLMSSELYEISHGGYDYNKIMEIIRNARQRGVKYR